MARGLWHLRDVALQSCKTNGGTARVHSAVKRMRAGWVGVMMFIIYTSVKSDVIVVSSSTVHDDEDDHVVVDVSTARRRSVLARP